MVHCELSQVSDVHKQLGDAAGHGATVEGLAEFPEELRELVAKELGEEPASPGQALKLLSGIVPKEVSNAVRGSCGREVCSSTGPRQASHAGCWRKCVAASRPRTRRTSKSRSTRRMRSPTRSWST